MPHCEMAVVGVQQADPFLSHGPPLYGGIHQGMLQSEDLGSFRVGQSVHPLFAFHGVTCWSIVVVGCHVIRLRRRLLLTVFVQLWLFCSFHVEFGSVVLVQPDGHKLVIEVLYDVHAACDRTLCCILASVAQELQSLPDPHLLGL